MPNRVDSELKARAVRLVTEHRLPREGVAILRAATSFFAGNSTPSTADFGGHRYMRSQGHTVESVCRVLSSKGRQMAARTYREWKRPGGQ